ncbi:VWA domain-containing protein [Dysgonomonas sp. OttesenSCG-928-M03]|nr:VWA domain-containing protein [Dysgonomonas sp. OttesenSCG-928-M03]
MKKLILSCSVLMAMAIGTGGCAQATSRNNSDTERIMEIVAEAPVAKGIRDVSAKNETKIQVAILLDTSGSMSGLINQAKSRLWNIVNILTTLKYQGKSPMIEIALYEYGSSRIGNHDYVRQVTPLTTDLDLISEKLFALTTGGSVENCGTVIDNAMRTLEWGNNESDMKLIYIAGNEEFTQGRISYKTAIENSLKKDIYVNTIHCGNAETGIRDLWRDAAIRGKGKFFNIDSNAKVRYVETPYDDMISHCNERLNKTYMNYGRVGYERQVNQAMQDENARSISKSNYAERAVSKSKSIYNNSSWDLVDRVKEDKDALSKIDKKELPAELQNKSMAELQKLVAEKEKERSEIQKEISELAKKRQEYIDAQSQADGDEDDLGKAVNTSILAFAKAKGYSFSE